MILCILSSHILYCRNEARPPLMLPLNILELDGCHKNILRIVLAATRDINLPARFDGSRSSCCCNSGGSCQKCSGDKMLSLILAIKRFTTQYCIEIYACSVQSSSVHYFRRSCEGMILILNQ